MNEEFSSYYQDNSPQSATPQGYPGQWSPQQGKSKGKLIIIIIIALVVIAVSVFIVLWLTGKDSVDVMDRDTFAEHNWYEAHSGSYLVPESNGNFAYYKDKGIEDDNYFTGTYEYYIGKDAIDYVVNDLSEYGVTRDEIKSMVNKKKEYKEENFVCIVLHNQHAIADGEEMLRETIDTPYYGFQLYENDENVLDIANMNTAVYYLFEEDAK